MTETAPSMRLAGLLPAEAAHELALLALRTGLWRVVLVIDGLVTLAWAAPCALMLRLERKVS